MTSDRPSVPEAWSGLVPTTRGQPIRPPVLPERAPELSPSKTRREVASGALLHPRRGAYLEPGSEDPASFDALTLSRLASLRETLEEPFVVIGVSAAVLLGLWHATGDGRVHIAVRGRPSGKARSDDWLVRHHIAIPDDQIRQHEGLLVTSMERTAVDCARSMPVRASQQTVDAALSIGCSKDEMRRILDGMVGYRGVLNARVAVRQGRKTGSPYESTIRVDIVAEGLPEPDTLVRLVLADGREVELDMGWRDIRLAVEAHGDAKYQLGADLETEPVRGRDVRERGWSMVDVRSRESRDDQMARVVRAFKAAWFERYRRHWRPE